MRIRYRVFSENEWRLNWICHLDDWLTVHRSITFVDLQLDAQNSYLFKYNTFIKILYMFRALPSSFSLISNAANYNTVILDNSVFTE